MHKIVFLSRKLDALSLNMIMTDEPGNIYYHIEIVKVSEIQYFVHALCKHGIIVHNGRFYETYGGCDRLTGDAYSSMAPDPTSDVSSGLCKPEFYCRLFHYLNWTLILIADFPVYLTRRIDFDSGFFCLPNLVTLILTTDFYV
jgi:hypothetical protein